MQTATKTRIILALELLVWLVAVVAGWVPGLFALMEFVGTLEDGVLGSFARTQLSLSLLMSGPVLLMLLGGMVLAGSKDPLFRLRLHGWMAVVLLIPTTLAALSCGGGGWGWVINMPVPWVVAIPLALLVLLPLWSLRSLRGREAAQTRERLAVWGSLALAVLLNIGAGFVAALEIATWV